MIFHRHTKRKAISPILAEVMLIAITLVAAVAISGFVFGMLGTYTNTAQIQIVSSSCSVSKGVCSVSFQNTGTVSGGISLISISFGGGGYQTMTGCLAQPVMIVPGKGPIAIAGCKFTGTAAINEQYVLSSSASSMGQPLGAGSFTS